MRRAICFLLPDAGAAPVHPALAEKVEPSPLLQENGYMILTTDELYAKGAVVL